MSVADLGPGSSFIVKGIHLSKEVGKRLADMGFTEGREGLVVRKGLMKGPLHVSLCGYELLLRNSEARGIEVLS